MAYHHGELARAAVLRAYAMIMEAPHETLSVRELAQNLGVTPRAIYRHHEDKHTLLHAVAVHAFEDLCEQVEALPNPEAQDPFVVLMECYVAFSLASMTRYRLMYGLAHGALRQHSPLWAQVKRLIKLTESAVPETAAMKGSHERRDHIMRVWGMVHGLLGLYHGGSLNLRSDAQAQQYIVDQVRAVQDMFASC